MIKTFLIKAAAAALAVGMLSFFGCSDSLNENNNMAYLLASKTAEESVKYGSITINGSRSIDVSTLTSATVTVSGYDMDDIEQENVDIVGGLGYATIRGIKVGKNRVVTVKSNIDGAVMRGVCDVEARDDNTCTVNWASTAVANVYYYLTKAETDVSSIESSSFSSKIPEVHASLFNAESFASDFKSAGFNASGLISSSYVLGYGDVIVSYKNVENYTVQVTDIASEKTVITTSAEGSTTLKGYPGEWKVKIFGADGTLKETKDVVIASGKDTKINIVHIDGSTPVTGKIIVHVPKSLGYKYIWAWATSGSTNYTGGTWPGKEMTKNGDYYDYTIEQKACKIIFNNNGGSNVGSNQTNDLYITEGEWNYIGGKSGTLDKTGSSISSNFETAIVEESLTVTVENPQVPVAPTVKIEPDADKISTSGAITVTLTNGNDTISAASVTLSGDVSKTYSYSNFTNDVLTINVSDLGITEAGKTITVNASVTNSVKTVTVGPKSYTTTSTPVVKDTFTWDNINCYFVLQDRFYSGDDNNNNCYGRVNSGVPQYATFHGGDIPGLTAKMDYFKKLGVNAIWITAPYEQMHGWTSGAGDAFPHYAFHGYYTLDWTFMDQNMGTVEEFRTFVQKCHENGIRVVMDVVMNHTGYEDWQDMIDYGFGAFKDASLTNPGKYNHACFATNGKYVKGGDDWGTNWGSDNFSKWWSSWCRGFDGKFGFANPGSDDVTKCLDGLPDVVQEKSGNVAIPAFLQTKWNKEVDNKTEKAYGNNTTHTYADYQNPSVAKVDWYGKSGNWRQSGKGSVVDYQVIWLSAWVRELGIDGFRCDTQKHVQEKYWKMLQQACQSALEEWRKDATKVDNSGAKNWDENFWMTGECCPRGNDYSGAPYTEGYFDSMINFRDSSTSGHSAGSMIKESEWSDYMYINNSPKDDNNNGNHNNLLTYVSSHDTNICHQGGVKLGTMLQLLPGGIQIFYGDESDRPTYSGASGDMVSRSDMNWNDVNGSKKAMVEHWGKVGNFRKYNPAVGAGSGTAYKRTYNGTNAGGTNKVAISISGGTVDVSGLFNNGTTVYNWYDGKSATVSSGKVTFNGGSVETPVLVSDRNPVDYGVTF